MSIQRFKFFNYSFEKDKKTLFTYLIVEFFLILFTLTLSLQINFYFQKVKSQRVKDIKLQELKQDILHDLSIGEDLLKVYLNIIESSDILIDDFLNPGKLSLEDIAENYLNVSQNVYLSFTPLQSTFHQLVNDSYLSLIESSELKSRINFVYNDLDFRNIQLSANIDAFKVNMVAELSPYIVVIPQYNQERRFIYQNLIPQTYQISSDYYTSNEVLGHLAEARNLTLLNADLLESFLVEMKEMIRLIDQELDS